MYHDALNTLNAEGIKKNEFKIEFHLLQDDHITLKLKKKVENFNEFIFRK